jgi:DnaK suppressor protein
MTGFQKRCAARFWNDKMKKESSIQCWLSLLGCNLEKSTPGTAIRWLQVAIIYFMNKDELANIQQLLLERKSELERLGQDSKEGSQPVELDQTRMGRLSRMDAMQQQAMTLELDRRGQQELRQIEGALRRIESGEFGDCGECGEEISLGRLKVNPTATRCIKCADR